jgi:hypothetical protein
MAATKKTDMAASIRSANLGRKLYKDWSVSVEFAKSTGYTRATAHRKLYEIRDLVVPAIRAFRKAHAHDRLARWFLPIEQEYRLSSPPPLTADLGIAFAQAREQVGVRWTQYLAGPSSGTWRALKRALITTRHLCLLLIAAGNAMWDNQ